MDELFQIFVKDEGPLLEIDFCPRSYEILLFLSHNELFVVSLIDTGIELWSLFCEKWALLKFKWYRLSVNTREWDALTSIQPTWRVIKKTWYYAKYPRNYYLSYLIHMIWSVEMNLTGNPVIYSLLF